MFALILIILLLKCLPSTGQADFECIPGIPYQENDCKECYCQSGLNRARLICSDKICLTDSVLVPFFSRKCSTGEEWITSCGNVCECVEDYRYYCTNFKCGL